MLFGGRRKHGKYVFGMRGAIFSFFPLFCSLPTGPHPPLRLARRPNRGHIEGGCWTPLYGTRDLRPWLHGLFISRFETLRVLLSRCSGHAPGIFPAHTPPPPCAQINRVRQNWYCFFFTGWRTRTMRSTPAVSRNLATALSAPCFGRRAFDV